MITILVIAIMIVIAIIALIIALCVGGIGAVIAYGDIIVAALLIIWILKKIFGKKKQ